MKKLDLITALAAGAVAGLAGVGYVTSAVNIDELMAALAVSAVALIIVSATGR